MLRYFYPSPSGTMITATPDKAHPLRMGGQALSPPSSYQHPEIHIKEKEFPMKIELFRYDTRFFSHAAIYRSPPLPKGRYGGQHKDYRIFID